MREPMDLLFVLWTPVGRRKHEFNRIRQVAPMCSVSIVFDRWRQCTQGHCAVNYAETAEPIDLPFGLWTHIRHSPGDIGAIW